MTAQEISKAAQEITRNVEKVIVGKGNVVELMLVAVMCEGHVLLEDVPGIGKTMLARSVSRSLGSTFRRVQCTPDLLPSDVTGTYVYNQKANEFEFRAGPIFAQVVLIDEINRATPRTQSALLEAMEERQVTVEGDTKALPRPFLVMATQNPIELEGTFPLPEAQLDRFLLKIRMGYPSEQEDITILERFAQRNPIEELKPVITSSQLLELQQACREVMVGPDVKQYIVDIVHASRKHADVELGASPRAMIGMFRASQALAALRGRTYVIPDDVKYMVPFLLEHRIIPLAKSHLKGQNSASILRYVLDLVPVPVEAEHRTKAGG